MNQQDMPVIGLSVKDAAGTLQASASGAGEVCLVYEPEYRPGDQLCVTVERPGSFLVLRLDDTMPPAFVYCKGTACTFPVPFGEARTVYSQRAFTGTRHYLHARLAREEETAARKNLAFNPWATHEPGGPFPYASANVETRGEMVFAAKNAIDGWKAGDSHGEWPYTSWGINRDPRAAWRLDFGRMVELDEAVVYLRADFPHDAWWKEAVLHFSDGSDLVLTLEKTGAGQHFSFPPRRVEWLVLDSLIKADDPSPFPALTQLELWGKDLMDPSAAGTDSSETPAERQ